MLSKESACSERDTTTDNGFLALTSNLGRVVGQAGTINPGSLADDLAGTFSGGLICLSYAARPSAFASRSSQAEPD